MEGRRVGKCESVRRRRKKTKRQERERTKKNKKNLHNKPKVNALIKSAFLEVGFFSVPTSRVQICVGMETVTVSDGNNCFGRPWAMSGGHWDGA